MAKKETVKFKLPSSKVTFVGKNFKARKTINADGNGNFETDDEKLIEVLRAKKYEEVNTTQKTKGNDEVKDGK